MNIHNAQQAVDDWIRTHGVRYFNELTNNAVLMEEVGELSRLIARIHGEQSFKTPMSEATQKLKLADEMADVLFVLTCLANQMDINLTEALERNIEKKTSRDQDRHRNNEKL